MLSNIAEEEGPKLCLPEVNTGPVTCQPQGMDAPLEVRTERARAASLAKKVYRKPKKKQ